MKNKNGKKIKIYEVELKCFDNGFKLLWDSNIGFGEMVFHSDMKVETEAMSDNSDKRFIKLILDEFIEKLEVIE